MSKPFNKGKALEIYRTMIEYQAETGFNMCYREIAEKLKYKSYSWVYPYMNWLKVNGYVKTKGKQAHAFPQEAK